MFESVMKALAQYRLVFLGILLLLVLGCIGILTYVLIMRLQTVYKEKTAVENKKSLKMMDYNQLDSEQKGRTIRQIIAPDAIDPAPNSYFILQDGSKTLYVRTFTIKSLPKKLTFNVTFANLFNFPNCTSSIFINPISDREISNKFDRQITILESEHMAAKNDTNRQRKLESQYQDTEDCAIKVENGEEKYFHFGFLFSLYAESVEQLNRISDEFHSLALAKNIHISSCYGVQAEAYVMNLPLNQSVTVHSKHIDGDIVEWQLTDRKGVSTVFNYTESTYTHRDGIPLGRDIFSRKPFIFNIYDSSHDGFLIVIAGKTGSGKSAAIKMMCERYAPHGYRFVCIDSQKRKGTGEGEYAFLAESLDGINFQISGGAENVLNPFEVHETVSFEKKTQTNIRELRTLELADKILLIKNDILTMLHDIGNVPVINLNRVITDCISDVYSSFGIYDKMPESLYEVGDVVVNGTLTSGLVPKKLPTISDFYRRVLCAWRDNRDTDLESSYKAVIYGLKDYVRELYYSEKTIHFFSRDEYRELDSDNGIKVFVNEKGEKENVIEVRGVRPYFDGQSTLDVSEECQFTNIDISPLLGTERVIAREIAINYVTERFIKGNANISGDSKLVAIFDEAHENFKYAYARDSLGDSARTARKYHASIIFSTQTIVEFERYPETVDILKQAAVKMVFKQDAQDAEKLKKLLHITDAEVETITNYIGVPDEMTDESEKNKHRGEMCVIDNSHVLFVKVDYLKKTERLSVETSAEEMAAIYNVSKAG